jgi:hypothetical protein
LYTALRKGLGPVECWEGRATGEDSAVNDLVIGTAEQMARSGKKNTHSVLMEKPGLRWKDNRKTELKAMRWDGMDWIGLAQDTGKWLAVVNTALNLRIP